MSKQLDPRALFRPGDNNSLNRNPDWHPRASFSHQWDKSPKDGLTEAQKEEGAALAKRLDELDEIITSNLARKARESIR